MDLAAVKALIAALEASSLTSLTYESGGLRLSLSRGAPPPAAGPAPPAPAAQKSAPTPATAPQSPGLHRVTAPLVGSVYRAREPGGQPLVSVGDRVAEGEPLCLIEAMKMFSELPAPRAGIVRGILFDDGQLAEYGMPLFDLEALS